MQSLAGFRRIVFAALLSTLALSQVEALGQDAGHAQADPSAIKLGRPFLFAGFKGDSKDGVYYAISLDGYHWKLANGGNPVVAPTAPGELMRDPFIQRAPDGSGFRMVWTWAWYDAQNIGYSESKDLVHWTPHREIPVMAAVPGAHNVWAPALYYDITHDHSYWVMFWASTVPGKFPDDGSGDNGLNHRIFSTTTSDFHSFTPAKVFFDPGYSVIDATELPPMSPGKPYTLIFKDERKTPLEKHLLTATGPTAEGPWSNISQPISETWSEGAAIIPVVATATQPAGYLAYYDHYSQGQHYGAIFSPDLTHWTDALSQIDFPAGMRHGSFLQITRAEYDRLSALKNGRADGSGSKVATQ